jgi:hypothetical protein
MTHNDMAINKSVPDPHECFQEGQAINCTACQSVIALSTLQALFPPWLALSLHVTTNIHTHKYFMVSSVYVFLNPDIRQHIVFSNHRDTYGSDVSFNRGQGPKDGATASRSEDEIPNSSGLSSLTTSLITIRCSCDFGCCMA